MITAQDIREKAFDKSRIGGYDMASVDDFLEELADDVAAYQKESAVLKSKMKVLVDKIEEYRANEEALNMAVLSAQKLAVQIENDARTRAAAMIADADRQVNEKIGGIAAEEECYNKRLADAKAATEKFFEAARALCNAQLRNIDAISGGAGDVKQPAAAPAADIPASESTDVDTTVRSIEESVSRIKPEPEVDFDLSDSVKKPAKLKKDNDRTMTFGV